jgi:hypothetical protein
MAEHQRMHALSLLGNDEPHAPRLPKLQTVEAVDVAVPLARRADEAIQ